MIILILELPLDSTGVGTYSRQIINCLKKSNKEFVIWDYTNSIKSEPNVIVKKYPFHIKYLKLLLLIGLNKFIKPIIQGAKDDLIFFPTASILTAYTSGKKIISIHDLMHEFFKFPEVSKFPIYHFRKKLYSGIGSDQNNLCICDSINGQKHWKEFYETNSKSTYIKFYSSYNLEQTFKNLDPYKSCNQNYLIYPAAFWEHKNHKRLIDAFHLMLDQLRYQNNYQLILCGKRNKLRDRLKKYVNQISLSDNIIFIDYVSETELISYYLGSKGLIFPSFFGPTNIPPLEAISLSIPMAVSNVFDSKELYGEKPIYFDPTDVVDIAEACYLLLKNPNPLDYIGSLEQSEESFNQQVIEILKIH